MDLNKKVLSDIVVFNKYAKYIEEKNRRETFEEIVDRCKNMHLEHFKDKGEEFAKEINDVFDNFVKTKKVLPSMRSAQFAGKAVEMNPARQYNCSFLAVDNIAVFSEAMFLLLSGTGVGYSVQKHHVEKLPQIKRPNKFRRYVIEDSIAGWADAIKMMFKAYFNGKSMPLYDYRDIREKGATLVTSGGKAPGPEPLRNCLHKIKMILERKKDGENLTTLECHDIVCHIADAVLSGGIRRAACISLFSMDDEDMLSCKVGNWWELNPQRGRSNNSVVILRHRVKKDDFLKLWERIQKSGSGEPGFYFTNNAEWGVNPCCFTFDTKIKTEHGYCNIGQLVNKNDLKLFNYKNQLVPAKVWSNGVKKIITVRLSSGEKINCTPDHRFMLVDGSECEAKDLKGQRLMPEINISKLNHEYVQYGFIQGDGSLSRLNSTEHKGLEVHFGSKDSQVASLFNVEYSDDVKAYYITGYNDILKELQFDSRTLIDRGFPESFDMWSDLQQQAFLKGMFSANGSVIKGHRVAYKAVSKNLITKLSEVLSRFGISNYITTNKSKDVEFSNGTYTCRESYDLNINNFESIRTFAKLVGFIHDYKNEALVELITQKSPMVTSIRECGEEEVFDFSLEDDTHWGLVGNGFVAHNCEIALRSNQMCNLSTVNVTDIKDQTDLEERVSAASFIGTLQAAYTDFYYLRDVWKRTCEKEALIGVSMTGIASNSYLKCDLSKAAEKVKETNIRVSGILGINQAARTTCIKPEGTASLVLGSSSGIHAWFSPYYIRRMKVGKNEDIYKYLEKKIPGLLEDDLFSPSKDAYVTIPIAAPEGAITSDTESPLQLLDRIKTFSNNWIKSGHVKGDNTHNVSATVYIKENEWESIGEWMWNHRDSYNGLSVLPFDGGTYNQTPFERITKEKYDEMSLLLNDVDLSDVIENENKTDVKSELACGGGGVCELQF